jgi:hypothetical protein
VVVTEPAIEESVAPKAFAAKGSRIRASFPKSPVE